MKLTLDETWEKCLEMWKWVSGNYRDFNDVGKAKGYWMSVHEEEYVSQWCYFCAYTGGGVTMDSVDCEQCPGKKVNKRFHCMNESYDYYEKPKALYKKLAKLNEKRLK